MVSFTCDCDSHLIILKYYSIIVGSKRVANEITPDVITPGVVNGFWISWRNGHIEIGKSRYKGWYKLLEYKVK